MAGLSKIIIAVPVKNEEARIGLCLDALFRQTAAFDQILLLLNNCTDRSLEICAEISSNSGKLHIMQCTMPADRASAGEARRLVLNQAAEISGNGIILTTDADAVPGENWVRDNLREIARGADVVCGMAKLEPQDALTMPKDLRIDEKNEARLMAIHDEIAAMLDADPADPWPRHQHHSGASIALRAGILRQAGGAPFVATGEDRALIEQLQRVGARVRHTPKITVHVSGRLEGRAEGGMAATLKRRLQQRDMLTDARLEPTVDAYRRVLARARLRAVVFGQEDAEAFAEDLLISVAMMRHALRASYFGAAWAEIQRLSPVLHRRPVAFSNLRREIRQAIALRGQLRAELRAPRISQPIHTDEGNFSRDENAS